jgi:hypothetical protein
MKRTAFGCTKITRLKTRLKRPLYVCWGILEGLWQLCARETPAGNIGKLSDEDIAGFLDWEDDPAELIAALCDTRWLDRDPVHRLLVHDWDVHADDAVNMALARTIQLFACGSMPKLGRLSKEDRMRIEPLLLAKQSKLNRTPAESVRTPPSNTPLFDDKSHDKCAHTSPADSPSVLVSPENNTKVCALPCPALPLPCPAVAKDLRTTVPAARGERTAPAAPPLKKAETDNGNGHHNTTTPQQPKVLVDRVWDKWDLTCAVLREIGVSEEDVREVTSRTRSQLAKNGFPDAPIEFFWDWLGIVYQGLQKQRQGTLKQNLGAFVSGWLTRSLVMKKPAWSPPPREYGVAKNCYLRHSV